MSFPPPVLIPLGSALVYTLAAIYLKSASDRGAGPWRACFITNVVQAVCFGFWWLQGGTEPGWALLWEAGLAGTLFFVGQVLTFAALGRGDVSVVTPALGSKVLFVALFGAAFGAESLTSAIWVAVMLTLIAVTLLGGGRRRAAASTMLPCMSMAVGSAPCYAVHDVLWQMWAPAWGFGRFAPTTFAVVALLSLTLIPKFSAPLSQLPKQAWIALIPGSILLSIQASGIAYAIITYQQITVTNIAYNSRGIWSVVLVWVFGHWLGNNEPSAGKAIMLRRLTGAVLLLAAIFLIVR